MDGQTWRGGVVVQRLLACTVLYGICTASKSMVITTLKESWEREGRDKT
jgi:hypothetical protein